LFNLLVFGLIYVVCFPYFDHDALCIMLYTYWTPLSVVHVLQYGPMTAKTHGTFCDLPSFAWMYPN